MTTLSQSADHDIALATTTRVVDGVPVPVKGFALASGREAYAMVIADAVRTLKGELQLDAEAGIPYMETAFRDPRKIDIWKYYVQKRINEFSFVKGVENFVVDFDRDTSKLNYSLTVLTTDGNVVITP